jgi:two-component system, OmpR family, sensor histidine kinase SenX3
MGRRFRLPMFAVAAAMLGLIAVLATLQYKWLGQISAAERERMRATLNTRATGFAHDFDRELTRAYLLFQVDAAGDPDGAARVSARYDRWHATARFPRMIGGIYLVTAEAERTLAIERFDPSTRLVEPAEWPDTLRALREQVSQQHLVHSPDGLPVRAIPSILADSVPALVVPTPIIVLDRRGPGDVTFVPRLSFTILVLDREYLAKEMLPALADQHFRGAGEGFDYRLAVVRPAGHELVYQSARDFTPAPGAPADAAVDLFAVRLQDFSALAAEVRRFTTFFPSPSRERGPAGRGSLATTVHREAIAVGTGEPSDRLTAGDGPKMSIVVQQGGPGQHTALTTGFATAVGARAGGGPKWKLLVTHPAGSLEAAVQKARRRNVLISSGIFALLGASMGLLVLSTRRAQRLAAQQMEFVAAVSHELRTPLAVIRSAGENLADGVVASHEQIRKYGDLVRNEGRRLTEMVEQILAFAGIQSGQRGFALRPVAVRPLLDDIIESSRALVDGAGMRVDIDVPAAVPPVLGDEEALRRVFQNLLANAIKYGASGGWIGIRAQGTGREVRITVSDRGIGIAPAEHAKIFEPFYRTSDVIAAQIHGAGLGLSLVKRIVEAHGGRISVRSAPGQGSDFTVQLPAAGEQPIAASDGERREPAAHAAGVQS